MAVFTDRQQKAIDLKNRNILVSASAGTGKTSVLTERILKLILDADNPVNIDEMVVVTFTRAAASEMRERIEAKLSAQMGKGDNNNIRRQIALLPHAQITTLHSLCLNIIRNYFYTIGIDPSFRIGDEQEIKLMMRETLEELLEEKYSEKSPEFIHMTEALAPGKQDSAAGDAIADMYKNAESHPWPYEWLMQCKQLYLADEVEEMDKSAWLIRSGLLSYTEAILKSAEELLSEAMDMCRCEPDLDKVYVFLGEERENICGVLKCNTYSEYNRKLREFVFGRFPSVKSTDKKMLKDEIKSLRDTAKDRINKLIKGYYYKDAEIFCAELKECREIIDGLCDTAAEYRERFISKKRENNVMDFNDIEHYALEILQDKDGMAAREIREKYRYILVDEYQDINEVQETIISLISREEDGEPNVFMVGDVKQSIYGFRLAKPEIFESKKNAYTDEDSLHQRIMLKRNFRSSPAILGTVNFIFSHIMKKELGKIEYDETHEFEYEVPEPHKDCGDEVEVIYVSEEGIKGTEYNKRKLEASCIAARIKQITDPETGMTIVDAHSGIKRTVVYDDIVILLRSMKGWSEEFTEALMEEQIPVSADEHTGYFSAREIQLTISMLKIVDNPHQDIALVAVLRSVFGGFTDDELAAIRVGRKKCDLFDAVCSKAQDNSGGMLSVKCGNFLKMIENLRNDAPYVRVYELIEKIYGINDFFLNMEVMPQGERRVGNLRMLIDKAAVFEGTDKRSLFDFLEYIEKMKSAEIDFGEMGTDETGNGAVKIMSIHKSKGLEFPVVFVAGMGKQPNLSDVNKNIVIHSDVGPGIDYLDIEKRVRYRTLIKKAISRRIIDDSLGEELRVLYVAFTRAKNKLILTGTVPDIGKLFEKSKRKRYSYADMAGGKVSYYMWLTPCFMIHPSFPYGDNEEGGFNGYAPMKFEIYGLSEAQIQEGERLSGNAAIKDMLINVGLQKSENSEFADYVEKEEKYRYPYEKDAGLVSKVSVSEIKRRAAEIVDEETVNAVWAEAEKPEYIPEFAKEDADENITRTRRGTIYHSFMEHINLVEIKEEKDIIKLADKLIEKGILPENVISGKIVSVKKILSFCRSPLAKRMKDAQEKGLCYVEQPFVMGMRAKDIYPDTDSEEIILVQGIIDAFFKEDGQMVLVDYKTDRLSAGEEEKLIKRYRAQMDCYKSAIEKSTGRQVKEMILYSFSLDKEINI